MLPNELKELVTQITIQKTESQNIEVKMAALDCPKRLYDTLSSFSNQDSGGYLVFGIDESTGFSVVGVYDLHDLQKKVTEQCNQMEPPVRAVFTTCEYSGKYVCCAEIPGMDISQRPCYYKGAGRVRGSYIRVGEADVPMNDFEIYSFEAYRKHLHDDERPIERALMSMMDKDALTLYLERCQTDRPGFAKLNEEQSYEMLNITRNGVPTLAAVLNFGIYPQGYFPQLAITAMVVPGKEFGDVDDDNARFTDNRRIEGTIPEMVKEALAFCRRNMKVRTIVDPDSGERKDRTQYPINAVREAVLNALIHRDYSIYSESIPVQIIFFADRLEIHSPGGLYGRMTVEQLGYAKMDLRNPALAVMTESITEAENRNSGIPTMRREMMRAGLAEPLFENKRDEFVVTLYNGAETDKIDIEAHNSSYQYNLINFCKTPRSRDEIADFLKIGTSYYAYKQYVKPLVEQGKLAMTIPDKPSSRNQRFISKL